MRKKLNSSSALTGIGGAFDIKSPFVRFVYYLTKGYFYGCNTQLFEHKFA